ncbi:MAG: maleylpyruvate isomerase family mycothiol-dependent enzyme [Actinophytocola sp.]|uniref:maleylpyruvate isomerase family mycothiol-dependent enzyme n=1 Tax=Actinophytocola sp. TaxID=1872138 RepID=UPI00132808DA|nr:maleylpyruvate isomerase family mycothiol-dependent enzyme [Actinophytocola sp.]MPZ79531.1 maleylpyruvate isomerase family mycothiol-dependent enzyme [Actinophytocola sp.]
MRVFDMIVDERRRMADLVSTLSADQLRTPSLCAGWTVHDVAAHLVTYLRFGQLKLYAGIVATAADFDRLNGYLTRREARRPTHEIVDRLRRRAGSRVTIPRSGYDPVLADIVLHDLDIRTPLAIPRDVPEDRLWVAFDHLTTKPSPGFAMGSRLAGLELRATDAGWSRGSGAPVHGPATSLLLAVGGRSVALADLTGDGVPLLRDRTTAPAPKPGPLRRLAGPLTVLLRPPPKDRRSRDAVPTVPG